MKKNKVTVSWSPFVSELYGFDFGLFKATKHYQIEVEKDLWRRYIEARFEFECLQGELVNQLKKKVRNA